MASSNPKRRQRLAPATHRPSPKVLQGFVPPSKHATGIDDLPDDCLIHIFRMLDPCFRNHEVDCISLVAEPAVTTPRVGSGSCTGSEVLPCPSGADGRGRTTRLSSHQHPASGVTTATSASAGTGPQASQPRRPVTRSQVVADVPGDVRSTCSASSISSSVGPTRRRTRLSGSAALPHSTSHSSSASAAGQAATLTSRPQPLPASPSAPSPGPPSSAVGRTGVEGEDSRSISASRRRRGRASGRPARADVSSISSESGTRSESVDQVRVGGASASAVQSQPQGGFATREGAGQGSTPGSANFAAYPPAAASGASRAPGHGVRGHGRAHQRHQQQRLQLRAAQDEGGTARPASVVIASSRQANSRGPAMRRSHAMACRQCGAWPGGGSETPVYDSSKQFQHALVCRRWMRVAVAAVASITLKEVTRMPAMRLVAELSRLANITHLSIPHSGSLPSLTPRFWSALPSALRFLRVLRLGSPGKGERGQSAALQAIFTHCSLLEELECRNINHVRHIPESLGLATQLVRLSLRKRPTTGASIIAYLPNSIGHLTRLEELDLRGCVLLSLPSSLASLPALHTMRVQVEGVRGPGLVPQVSWMEPCIPVLTRMRSASTLRALQLSTFTSRELPESMFLNPRLVSLSIHCCPFLASVPLTAPALGSLRHIRLINCEAVVTLPDCLGELHRLESLDIAFCTKFSSIPESAGSLSTLRTITLVQCPELKALPESIGGMQGLEELRMFECAALRELPQGLGSLTALRKLFVYKCPLQSLPRTFLQLLRRNTTVYLVGKGAKALLSSFRHCNFRSALDGTFAVTNVTEPEEDGRWLSSYFTSLEQFL